MIIAHTLTSYSKCFQAEFHSTLLATDLSAILYRLLRYVVLHIRKSNTQGSRSFLRMDKLLRLAPTPIPISFMH